MSEAAGKGFWTSSIVVISVAFLFGIGSIISTAVAWNVEESWDSDDGMSGASAAAVSLGAFSLVTTLVAVPLAFCAGREFLKARGGGSTCCLNGWMITSWVLYGLFLLNGLSAVGVGAAGGDVYTGWVVFLVLMGLVIWSLMFSYAETARRLEIGISKEHEPTQNAFTSDEMAFVPSPKPVDEPHPCAPLWDGEVMEA